eukprot:TRINITY_DN15853_c0_g1_i1.p2 TRINITY_DN15853_c0_g1~~TRINITY_DN15853_c0_g1_i1.p2  ORF type:complete len:161 (-),score=8.69 TRINITY_DN15853_c0_g1_i1:17-499(-)
MLVSAWQNILEPLSAVSQFASNMSMFAWSALLRLWTLLLETLHGITAKFMAQAIFGRIAVPFVLNTAAIFRATKVSPQRRVRGALRLMQDVLFNCSWFFAVSFSTRKPSAEDVNAVESLSTVIFLILKALTMLGTFDDRITRDVETYILFYVMSVIWLLL